MTLRQLPIAILLFAAGLARGQDLPAAQRLGGGDKAFLAGRFSEAEEQYKNALKKAEADGRDGARVAECLARLAAVHTQRGAFGQADHCCEQALILLREVRGADLHVARCLNLRADNYRRLGLHHAAATYAQRSLDIREKALGPRHFEVAQSLETLGWIFLESPGEADVEVKTAFATIGSSRMPGVIERARSIRERTAAKDLPGQLNNRLLWANYYLNGRAEEEHCKQAEKAIRQAEELAKRIHGDEHPALAECLMLRAHVHRHREKYTDAAADQRRAQALLKKCLGPRHDRVGAGMRDLAELEYLDGRRSQAADLFAESLLCRFSGVNDADLCRFFWIAFAECYRYNWGRIEVYEWYLTEMVRRGGATIEACLKKHDARLRLRHQHQLLYREAYDWLREQSFLFDKVLARPEYPLRNCKEISATVCA